KQLSSRGRERYSSRIAVEAAAAAAFGSAAEDKRMHNHTLILTPRMIMSMEILQLPRLALGERIQQEIQDNPLLGELGNEWASLAAAARDIPVLPDIAVERDEDGEYTVHLPDDWLPSISISRRYIDLYREKDSGPKTREYLKRKIQAAQWLQESIEQ